MAENEVKAIDIYGGNAGLILALRDLGYIEGAVWDATYGEGTFWKLWRPDILIGTDIIPEKSVHGTSVDFTSSGWLDREYDTVVLDPPYKLNGTPDKDVDERYGTHKPTRWQDRMQLCRDGIVECARVADKWLLVKCQDQVCSGKKRWQTMDFTGVAFTAGFRLHDMLHMMGGRPQPKDRRQVHSRGNYSTMLVLKREP